MQTAFTDEMTGLTIDDAVSLMRQQEMMSLAVMAGCFMLGIVMAMMVRIAWRAIRELRRQRQRAED